MVLPKYFYGKTDSIIYTLLYVLFYLSSHDHFLGELWKRTEMSKNGKSNHIYYHSLSSSFTTCSQTCSFNTQFHLILTTIPKVGTMIVSILQLKKPRLQELRDLYKVTKLVSCMWQTCSSDMLLLIIILQTPNICYWNQK